MKKQITLLVAVATLACCSISQASILDASWVSQNTANLTCTYLYPFANNTLDMDGVQYAGTAQMVATINTDTPADPTLTLSSAVNNDTAFAWNGYQVNVVMSVPFTIGPSVVPPVAAPTVGNPPVNDWTVAGVTPAAFQGSGPWAGFYEATVFYSAGTLVGIGGELDFTYQVNFASSTHYILTQEMIPSMVPVPEPSTLAVAAMGGLALALRLRRSSRKAA